MEVCDSCMEEDILLRHFDEEIGDYEVYCPKCTLEQHFNGILTDEDYQYLEDWAGIKKETFEKDWEEIYHTFYGSVKMNYRIWQERYDRLSKL